MKHLHSTMKAICLFLFLIVILAGTVQAQQKIRVLIDASKDGGHLMERLLMQGYYLIVRDRKVFAMAHKLGSKAMRIMGRDDRIRAFPLPPLASWTRKRDFPTLALKSFHEIWRERLSKG